MADSFDPFDLPSGFDPLCSDSLAPTGQSAYLRREPNGQSAYLRREPNGQSASSRQGQPDRRQGQGQPPAPPDDPARDPVGIGAGGRLAHLLPAAGKMGPAGNAEATLQALEDEITFLTARLDSLEATLVSRLQDQHLRTVQAVAALMDERLGRRG